MMKRLAAPLLCSSFFLLMACGSNNTNSKVLNKIQLQKQSKLVVPNKFIRSRQSHILMSLGQLPLCLISGYW